MQTSELDLRELLSFKPQGGAMTFLGQRIFLTDILSHGLHCMELQRTFGEETTKSFLVRSGFAKGWLLAEQIKRQIPESWAEAKKGKLGPLLCSMYGFGEVLSSQRQDGIINKPLVETYFTGLFEAEQSLHFNDVIEDVACWEQMGFASGYVSNLENRTVYFVEHECQAKGDRYCHLSGNYLEEWDDQITPFLPYYDNIDNERMQKQLSHLLHINDSIPIAMMNQISRSLDIDNTEADFPICHSDSMRRLLDMANNIAQVPSSILLTGESGVGKEKLVKFIHKQSPRKHKPFVAINCGALAESLLENELFGHAKGAYTGADNVKQGLIESANGGTLFLDEVGELSPAMQVKLLRVLQEKELRKVGDNKVIKIDVRIISATNKNLEQAVQNGEFRQDLYYRLKVIGLTIPPLRKRREDILPLCRYFLDKFNELLDRDHVGFNHKTADLLLSYHWPGNVRELVNCIEHASVLGSGPQIQPEDLPEEIRNITSSTSSEDVRTLHDVEKDHILNVLHTLDNNKALAANKLGMSLATLYRKLKEYDE